MSLGSPPASSTSSPRSRPSVRRQVVVPDAERLEGAPEALLGAFLVERKVDVRHVERVDRRGEGLDLSLALLDRAREGNLEAVEDLQRRLAHDDDDLRLHARPLLAQAADALAGGGGGLGARAPEP